MVAAGAGAAAVGAAAAGARRHCSASLDKRCHGQVSHFPAALGRRAASRMLYCPRRKRTGARLLVAHSKAVGHAKTGGFAFVLDEYRLGVGIHREIGPRRENPSLARSNK